MTLKLSYVLKSKSIAFREITMSSYSCLKKRQLKYEINATQTWIFKVWKVEEFKKAHGHAMTCTKLKIAHTWIEMEGLLDSLSTGMFNLNISAFKAVYAFYTVYTVTEFTLMLHKM